VVAYPAPPYSFDRPLDKARDRVGVSGGQRNLVIRSSTRSPAAMLTRVDVGTWTCPRRWGARGRCRWGRSV